MPITINGSGTIDGINIGGLPDGCIATADLANNAVTYAKIGSTEQGQLCKAWVNFNGTGTVAIRASYNVSSITDNAVGDYTVNFTSALANANYATQLAVGTGSLNSAFAGFTQAPYGSPTTSAVRVSTGSSTSAVGIDWAYVSVAIFL